MRIEPLTPQNIDALVRIDKRFKYHWSECAYLERIDDCPDLSFGAFIDDILVGFIMGRRDWDSIIISRIAVRKKYEGKGIGGKLLEHLLAMGCKDFRSVVRVGNERSLNMHLHRGFEEVKEHLYSNGDKGIVLIKY